MIKRTYFFKAAVKTSCGDEYLISCTAELSSFFPRPEDALRKCIENAKQQVIERCENCESVNVLAFNRI